MNTYIIAKNYPLFGQLRTVSETHKIEKSYRENQEKQIFVYLLYIITQNNTFCFANWIDAVWQYLLHINFHNFETKSE